MVITQTELELAWEEVTFWEDLLEWRRAEYPGLPEPRILAALENAWRRYERALHLAELKTDTDLDKS